MMQIAEKSSRLGSPIFASGAGYGWPLVAPGAMIEFLARVAREARRERRIKVARVAVAADLDPSTIYRFERGQWPGNADQVVAAYAEELEVAPETLWMRALELWCEAEAAGELSDDPEDPGRATVEIVAGLASQVEREAVSPRKRTTGRSESSGARSRRKPA